MASVAMAGRQPDRNGPVSRDERDSGRQPEALERMTDDGGTTKPGAWGPGHLSAQP
jgi:hypothetical protein